VEPEANRAYYGYKEAIVSIVVNLLLFIIKFVIAIYINSIALLTDAVHSLSDIITSFLVIIGFRTSQKPPDREHPYGHGRSENIISLVISILLIIAGFEFLISSTGRLYSPQVVKGSIPFFLLISFTVFAKEVLARYSAHLSHRIDSHALLADAWHHRSDALSSIPVAFGILAARYGIYYVDSLSGIGVSLIIMYIGYKIARGSASILLGEAPSDALIRNIRRLAEIDGVTDVYDISVHDYGIRKVVSLRMKVEPMGLQEAHAIADAVEKQISDTLCASAIVHIDGFEVDDSLKEEIYNIVEEHEEVISCHALSIGEKIEFHILVDKDMSLEKAHRLAHHLEDDVSRRFKRDVRIHVEPCIGECEQCHEECEECSH
jgi:cation diffusion facilitator family transporter